MIYRCVVADDNIIDRDLIIKYLGAIDQVTLAAVCTDGIEVSKVLSGQQVDILFTDIDMPYLSGIGLIKNLKKPPVTVFVTSHAECAVEGFELDVIDFVVKPLTFERFFKAVNKAITYAELKNITAGQPSIAQDAEQDGLISKNDSPSDCFFIKETNGITRIKYADVLYIESLGDYSTVFTQNSGKHLTLVSLKNMQRQLPERRFKRVHKQYIVNLSQVLTITATDVILFNNQTVPISAAARQEMLGLLVNNNVLTR